MVLLPKNDSDQSRRRYDNMVASTQSTPGGGATEAHTAQIERLKSDSNATPAFKQQLDAWLQQLDAVMRHAASPEAGAAPAPAPPQAQQARPGPTPVGQTGGPTPTGAPASEPTGDALSGANVPQALKNLAPAIQRASEQTGVPQDRLAAVIWAESRGKAEASTTNGGNGMSDSGLMQINSATYGQLRADHPDLQGKSVNDSATNILAGAYLLADMKGQFGSWDLAQRAYNSGPGSVDVNNPDITTTGLGDPDYNRKVNGIKAALNGGQALPA